MATATYPARRSSASARIRMDKNGSFTVMSATQDIGTGTYTIVAQTAADVLGVPVDAITVKIGDSSLPPAPVSGGSTTAASVTAAVYAAAEMFRDEMAKMAVTDHRSKLFGKDPKYIEARGARLYPKGEESSWSHTLRCSSEAARTRSRSVRHRCRSQVGDLAPTRRRARRTVLIPKRTVIVRNTLSTRSVRSSPRSEWMRTQAWSGYRGLRASRT
jgi:CO/xanthine dehydrogenase Mo-binding subunit